MLRGMRSCRVPALLALSHCLVRALTLAARRDALAESAESEVHRLARAGRVAPAVLVSEARLALGTHLREESLDGAVAVVANDGFGTLIRTTIT